MVPSNIGCVDRGFKGIAFQDYVGEVVSGVSQALIPLTKSVVKPCYGFGRVLYKYIPEENVFVWGTPTAYNVESNDFSYYDVILKFVPELDREVFEDAAVEVFRKHVDLRRVDSVNIFIVSPKCRVTQIIRLKKFGRGRGSIRYKDLARAEKLRVRAIPVIAKKPEKALNAILTMITHFIFKRMTALAEHIHIPAALYDQDPDKLKSLLINGVYIIRREFVARFINYMATLYKALREKLNQLKSINALKDRIRGELEKLGIPAEKHYWKFKKIIDQIIQICKAEESRKLKWNSKRERIIEEALLNGNYIIPEKTIDRGYIRMPRINE